jgi:hypothetical protein
VKLIIDQSVIRKRRQQGVAAADVRRANEGGYWPAPGSEDTKLGVLMEREVRHGASEIYAGVQA